MRIRASIMVLALALAGNVIVAQAESPRTCPANILTPLATGFANPRTAKNPFEGDWCGFWGGSPSAVRIHLIGARTAEVVTTYMSGGRVFVSHDRANVRGSSLSYTTPGRGKLAYMLMGETLNATLHDSSGTATATFRRVK